MLDPDPDELLSSSSDSSELLLLALSREDLDTAIPPTPWRPLAPSEKSNNGETRDSLQHIRVYQKVNEKKRQSNTCVE